MKTTADFKCGFLIGGAIGVLIGMVFGFLG